MNAKQERPNDLQVMTWNKSVMVISHHDGSARTTLDLRSDNKVDLTPTQAVELAQALIRSARAQNPPGAPPLRIVIH